MSQLVKADRAEKIPVHSGRLVIKKFVIIRSVIIRVALYRELIDNGYIFNWWPWKYRVLSARAVKISSRVSKMLCRSLDNQRAGSFLKQRSSMALQIGNAACVLGTVSDRDAFEESWAIVCCCRPRIFCPPKRFRIFSVKIDR